MRDPVSSPIANHFSKVFAIGFAFAILSVVMPASPARGESRNVTVEAQAPAAIDLRRALELATGARPQPSGVARQVIDVMPTDEVFWDAFELCGDGVIDSQSEDCDRSDFGSTTCPTPSGVLACDRTCHFRSVCLSDYDCCAPLSCVAGTCELVLPPIAPPEPAAKK